MTMSRKWGNPLQKTLNLCMKYRGAIIYCCRTWSLRCDVHCIILVLRCVRCWKNESSLSRSLRFQPVYQILWIQGLFGDRNREGGICLERVCPWQSGSDVLKKYCGDALTADEICYCVGYDTPTWKLDGLAQQKSTAISCPYFHVLHTRIPESLVSFASYSVLCVKQSRMRLESFVR